MLQSVSTQQIDRFKAKRAGEVKPASVNRELGVLKRLLNVAVEWGYLYESPAKVVKLLRVDNRRLRWLTVDKIDNLLAEAARHLRPIISVAVFSGLRRGEIFSLLWENIDLINRIIEVVDSKNGDKRAIPMNATLFRTLNRLPRRIDSPFLFPGRDGGRLTDIKNSFQTARENAGLEDVRFHDLRHTFASQLVMAGADLMTVKELLGHKTIKMTERYSHLSPDHKARAVQLLDSLGSQEEAQKSG